MNKRTFLTTAAVGLFASAVSGVVRPAIKSDRGPMLLTVSGAINRHNRGGLDPALDQMLHKQKVMFAQAYAFDFADLTALPHVSIQPTLEYDSRPHRLRGPLLLDVMEATGMHGDAAMLILHAVDGYSVPLRVEDARKYRFIVATHLDEQPMSLGGLGPLWAMYDADRFPDMSAKPLNYRFVQCPWALYYIDVRRSDQK